MPRTPFGDRSPWESSTAFQNRTRVREEEEEKVRRLKQLIDESRRQSQFFESPTAQAMKASIIEQQEDQNRRYRGLLSGSHGFGLHDQDKNISEPLQMQDNVQLPQDDGPNLNPFSYIGKGLMAGLEGWQKATEWTAGQVATPFSQQVKSNRARGMSAGEAWRKSQFATKRFGADKEEDGFGFNLGVKGAVEMIVDPIGWASMAIPLGAIFRPIGKGVSSMASALPGVKGVRKAGQELLETQKGFDEELRKLSLNKLTEADFL